ncbi:DUF6493 family protein [Bremerella sp. JC817]|uniref:DUF7824 domain-containing protein n=1 Tax=Bremerella sp. JC817 TaxID=3231756 RepID=UPI003457B2EC
MIEALEAVILANDSAKVVEVLSTATEEERAASVRPLKAFWLALGIDRHVTRGVHPDLTKTSEEVVEKRKKYNLADTNELSPRYYSDLFYVAWLAWYGIVDQGESCLCTCVPHFEAESAQILADRNPPWIDQWLETHFPKLEDRDTYNWPGEFWVLLHQRGLLKNSKSFKLKERLAKFWIPSAYEKQPEATQQFLLAYPEAIEPVYEVVKNTMQMILPKVWVPPIQWMAQAGILDVQRFVEVALAELSEPHNQTERNGCIVLIKAALGKPVAATKKIVVAMQPDWIALLADAQGPIAGFGLDQLLIVEKAGKLNGPEVVVALPHLFNHKAKSHARKGILLLGRLAKDSAIRSDAVRGLAFALAHPAKEVQEDAIEQLALHIEASDIDAIESIQLHLETVAPTLRSRLETVVPGASESPMDEDPSAFDACSEDLEASAAELPPAVSERFQVASALKALVSGELPTAGRWKACDLRILDVYEPLQPIETVEELVQVTSAAVEACECPDTPERILDGITRLYLERPKHFATLTKSLKTRVCQEIMGRPMRGIVGAVLSEPMARCIGAWLGSTGFFEDLLKPSRFPPGDFMWLLADRLKKKTAYPIVSAPTHRGGWIDPRVWVKRLHDLEVSKVDLLECDLVRSLLRLTPDRREEAWNLVVAGTLTLSPAMHQLVRVALEPIESTEHLQLDDQWPIQVWIAAIRSREPSIDLTKHLPEEEISQIPEELWRKPDVLKPSNYYWRSLPETKGPRHFPIVDSEPMAPDDRDPLKAEVEKMKEELNGASLTSPDNVLKLIALGEAEEKLDHDLGFLTAQLHGVRCSFAPPYLYPYLATQWPMKLDWYWSLASVSLSRRVDSGASVEERYAQYLLPLLEPDCPLTIMAARALWIATVSKDGNAKGMAIEAWIELSQTDRCDVELLVEAWSDVMAGGWMKLNRVAEVFGEVSQAGPLAAWIAARTCARFLELQEALPRDGAKLLEIIDQAYERLGLPADVGLKPLLESIKSGKAKGAAKSIQCRNGVMTSQRSAALQQLAEQRIARAQRNSRPILVPASETN